MKLTIALFCFLVAYSSLNINDQMIENMVMSEIIDGATCASCQAFFSKFTNMTYNEFQTFAHNTFNTLCPKIEEKVVCRGISETYVDQFTQHFYKQKQRFSLPIRHALDPLTNCAKMDLCEDNFKILTIDDFIKEVLADKPSAVAKQQWIEQSSQKISGNPDYKILQLADLHVDLEYMEGYNAFCSEPFCCRVENGLPTEPKNGAQYWGTYADCDLPWRTINNMLDKIFNEIKPDVIVWTGDSISHDVWHQTKENQTLPTKKITELILQRLDVPLYPIYGNHEAYPCDQMDIDGPQSQWLKDEVYDIWQDVLEDQALTSLKTLGYYSQYNDKLNVRFIALNTQTCDSLNFYLLDNSTDPSQQIKWLREQLYQAEKNHEFVHIFGHIPPGDFFCQTQWAQRYDVLMERFQHLVRGQFYGHTHNDHVQVIKSLVDKSIQSVSYIAPSGTTYSYQNPSFRVFQMNGLDNSVINYQQIRLDLQKANIDGPNAILQWNVAYSFLEEYGLPNAKPETVYTLASILNNDEKKLKKYIFNFYSGSDKLSSETFSNLDSFFYGSSTKKFFICGIQSSTFDDFYDCNDLIQKIKSSSFISFKTLESLYGHWRVPQ